MTEQEHEEAVKQARLKLAAEWLRRMPSFPPNCQRMDVLIRYDDGKTLHLGIEEGQPITKRPLWEP